MISIIVGIFNVDKYLHACLKSIQCQSFTDFECIMVDDGSTDSSGSIATSFSDNDSRFFYHRQSNQGLSSVRNFGMSKAVGEYICFIDSDDSLEVDYLNILYTTAKSTQSDIVKCDFHRNSIASKDLIHENHYSIYDITEFMKDVLLDNIGSQMWQYLFKKKVLQDISFPSNRYAQDMFVLHEIVGNASVVSRTNLALYNYNDIRPDSTSNDVNKKVKGAFDRALAYGKRCEFACKNHIEYLLPKLYSNMVSFFNNGLFLCKDNIRNFDSDITQLRNYTRLYINHSRKFRFKQRLLCLLLAYCPYVYFYSRRIFL